MAVEDPNRLLYTPSDWLAPLPLDTMFSTKQPIEVDCGCGKGRFLKARAKANPDVNFIGLDRLLLRLRRLGKGLDREGIENARLLRIEISYAIQYLFLPGSVSAFYIFFPDPWPKKRHFRRRLFTPALFDVLSRLLVENGRIHIATDHEDYFAHIRQLGNAHPRLREVEPFVRSPAEQTDFELEWLADGRVIGDCSFEVAK